MCRLHARLFPVSRLYPPAEGRMTKSYLYIFSKRETNHGANKPVIFLSYVTGYWKAEIQ